jgi:hypothetical protein
MAGYFSGRALLAAIIAVVGLLVVALGLVHSAPRISSAALMLLGPGDWVASKWGNMHGASFPVLLVSTNLLFYYALFIAAIRLRMKAAAKRTS